MSKASPQRLAKSHVFAAAVTAVVALSAPAAAVDPVFDDMRMPTGPTATNPSESARNILRDADRAPTLTERFGLPPVSGPLPPLLPPIQHQPVLQDRGVPPPPPVPLYRARQPRENDG